MNQLSLITIKAGVLITATSHKCIGAAVSAYSKLYAESYASKNVRRNCVLPGHMDSLDHQATAEQAGPKNGIGTPQKIVKTVAFPLSGEAGYITGQSLRINGGVTRHI